MALVKATFVTDLMTAFAKTLWADCGTSLGTAFNNFILAGDVETVVTGSGTYPGGAPFSGTGTGAGKATPTGLVVMQGAISANLINPLATWKYNSNPLCVGKVLAAAVNTNILTAPVATTVTKVKTTPPPPDILDGGTGVGPATCINTVAVYSAFETAIIAAFADAAPSQSWALVSSAIADATITFLKGVTITTADTGSLPANGWAGAGSGNIQ